MFKKTSKSLVMWGVLLMFSLLLASCQSMLASTEEMEPNRAVEAWGANLTAQGESYLDKMERQKAVDAWGANLTAQGESYLEEMESNRAVEAWGANLTAQGERYLEEMEQASVPWIELRSEVPSEAEIMEAAFIPGIEIRRARLDDKTYLIIYEVMSDGPAWVVFHAEGYGQPGEILEYVSVESGMRRIGRTEILGEEGSLAAHVMLHEDLGTAGLFEFPGSDIPVFVDDEIVDELCFCPY